MAEDSKEDGKHGDHVADDLEPDVAQVVTDLVGLDSLLVLEPGPGECSDGGGAADALAEVCVDGRPGDTLHPLDLPGGGGNVDPLDKVVESSDGYGYDDDEYPLEEAEDSVQSKIPCSRQPRPEQTDSQT